MKQDIVEGIINLGMLARVVNIVEELSENGINRHESTPEKEHEITAGSQVKFQGEDVSKLLTMEIMEIIILDFMRILS